MTRHPQHKGRPIFPQKRAGAHFLSKPTCNFQEVAPPEITLTLNSSLLGSRDPKEKPERDLANRRWQRHPLAGGIQRPKWVGWRRWQRSIWSHRRTQILENEAKLREKGKQKDGLVCNSLGRKSKESQELMLSNCGAGEDSWESLGQQGDQTN